MSLSITYPTFTPNTTIASTQINTNNNDIVTWINGANVGASNMAASAVGASGGSDLSSHIVDNVTLALASNQLSIKASGVGASGGADLSSHIVDNSTLALTSNQLAVKAGGITGTQMVASVNLPGKVAAMNNQMLLVSNTNPGTFGLAIIRGFVAAGSSSVGGGEGFTVVFTGPNSYALTWTTAFTDAPVVIVGAGPGAIQANGGVICSATSTSGATVLAYNITAGTASSQVGFHFIAIGQKV